MDKRAFILAIIFALCGTMIIIGIVDPKAFQDELAVSDVTPTATPEEKTKVVTKVEVQTVPVNRPDGYISRFECERIGPSQTIRDLMWQFGWPAGDSGDDSYSGIFYYPIREDHADTCMVDTMGGKVNKVTYQEGN